MSNGTLTGIINSTRMTYFSPEADTISAFLDFIKTAQRKIRLADYSFNLEPLVELLIQKHQEGVDVSLVLDRSQAAGPSERPIIQQLKDGGVPLVVGTSSAHKIMHNKFTVVDDEWVQSGSWNYTGTAAKEDNFFDIEHSLDRAAVFNNKWQKMFDWISANEPQD